MRGAATSVRNRSSASRWARQLYSDAVSTAAPPSRSRSARSPSTCASASADRSRIWVGHQAVLTVHAEVAVAVGVGADDRTAGRHRLEHRQAEALVGRGLHEHGGLVQEPVDPHVRRSVEITDGRLLLASSGSIPNRYSSGRGSPSAAYASIVRGKFFRGLERPTARIRFGGAPRRPAAGRSRGRSRERSRSARNPSLRSWSRSRSRSSGSGTRGGRSRAPRAAATRCRGSSSLDVLDEVHGDPVDDARLPDRRGGRPPGCDLDRVDRFERHQQLVVLLEVRTGARSSNQSGSSLEASTARPDGRLATNPLICSNTTRWPPPIPVPSVT